MTFFSAKNIAQILHKSPKWVYVHAETLGGVKIGGTWIFSEKRFYDAIERGKNLERRGLAQRQAREPEARVQAQKRRPGLGAGGEKEAARQRREAAAKGKSLKTIQRVLRHKRLATTELYVHMLNQDLREVYEGLSMENYPTGPPQADQADSVSET